MFIFASKVALGAFNTVYCIEVFETIILNWERGILVIVANKYNSYLLCYHLAFKVHKVEIPHPA